MRRRIDFEGEEFFRKATSRVINRFSVIQNKPSVITLCGRGTNNNPVFVKYYKIGALSEADALEEYGALERYYAAMRRDQHYSVPQPYQLIRDGYGGATFLCEWVNLSRADVWFKWGMPFEFVRRFALRRCAIWLRHFHQVGSVTDVKSFKDSLDLDELNADFTKFAELLESLGCPQLCSAGPLLRAARLNGNRDVRHAVLHGDFAPVNVFIGARRVVGYDFRASVPGPILADVGRFLSSLIWYGHLSFPPRRGQAFLRDSDEFMTAYGPCPELQSPELVKIFHVRSLLDRTNKIASQLRAASAKTKARLQRNLQMVAEVITRIVSLMSMVLQFSENAQEGVVQLI